MSKETHHIIKLVFDLSLPKGTDSFEVHQKVSRYFREAVQPELTRLFDTLVSDLEVIRIDSMVIDLGNVPLDKFTSEEFLRRLLQNIKEQIQTDTFTHAENENVERLSIPENTCDQWLFYLKSGQLPWQKIQLETEWLGHVLEGFVMQVEFADQLTQLLKINKSAFQRLLWQHSDTFLIALAEIYSGQKQGRLKGIQRELFQATRKNWAYHSNKKSTFGKETSELLPGIDLSETTFRDYFWQSIVQNTIVRGKRWKTDKLVKAFLIQLFLEKGKSEKISLPSKVTIMEALPAAGKVLLEVIETFRKRGSRLFSDRDTKKGRIDEIENVFSETDDHVAEIFASQDDGSSASADSQENEIQHKNHLEATGDEKNIREWYINNAGVVLLHPYLHRFFERCSLMEKGVFKNDMARFQAVHLIHHLATGLTNPPEYELLLSKVLCEIPLTTPLPRKIRIPKSFCTEAENLLQVVSDQWSALGDVSFHSLREGFLTRKGKLSRKEGRWLVQMEQHTLDILLDRLPWNLSMIKLPWMKELLYVEWR